MPPVACWVGIGHAHAKFAPCNFINKKNYGETQVFDINQRSPFINYRMSKIIAVSSAIEQVFDLILKIFLF